MQLRFLRYALQLATLLSAASNSLLIHRCLAAEPEPIVPVAAQPLAANVTRLVESLDFLGRSLPAEVKKSLADAARKPEAERLQQVLDEHVLFIVEMNPESRVKVRRGPARAVLQQGGYTPVIVKVVNLSTVTKELRVSSPQAGQVYAGMTPLSAKRMQREPLRELEAWMARFAHDERHRLGRLANFVEDPSPKANTRNRK